MPKITIIDDDHGPIDYYSHALREAGFDVEHIETVDNALLHIGQEKMPSDFYIIDLMMPPGDALELEDCGFGLTSGIEIHKRLRAKWKDVPVLFLSSVSNPTIWSAIRHDEHTTSATKFEVLPSDLVTIACARMQRAGDSLPLSVSHVPQEMVAPAEVEPLGREAWRQMMNEAKQSVVRKFLMEPERLSASEFLLLSDLSSAAVHSVIREKGSNAQQSAQSSSVNNEKLLSEIEFSSSPHVRGRMLEELVVRLFNSLPGFTAKSRMRTETEEIDIFILNGADSAPWRDMGPALIGECKKWSAKCGTEEYHHLETKIRNRNGQCKCGFFVSWNGFTSRFVEERLRSSRENFVMLLIEGKDIAEAVASGSFAPILYRSWEEAVFA